MNPSPELLSLVLTLQPAAPLGREAPPWWGRAAHALLLQVTALAEPELAAGLHEENLNRPFTASSLFEGPPSAPSQRCLRFTALQANLARLLAQAVEPGGPLTPGASVELDHLAFTITAAARDPRAHGWAAQGDFASLAAQHLAPAEAPPHQVSLQLASPTVFKSQGRHQALPLPGLVFGSLLERWNAFAPIAFPPETRRYAEECLAVSRFDLHSRAVAGKAGGLRIGAVGRVTYTTLNFDRYWMSVVHTLAAFAFYAGLGAGVSQGLGQCRAAPTPAPRA